MSRSYLDQYSGAGVIREFVWRAIYQEGELTEGTTLWEDAFAVTRETMLRARQNIECIIDFLQQQGYNFTGMLPSEDGTLGGPWLPPGSDTSAKLERLSTLVGPIPLSLRAWWEIVGAVSLQGVFQDARGKTQKGQPLQQPMNDPLVVYPLWYALKQAEEPIEEGGASHGKGGFLLDLAPDLFHKANVSGGAPYSVRLPDRRADTPLLNVRILLPTPEGQRPYTEVETNETFVEYLRRSFQWAGFPGYAFLPNPQMERIRPLFSKMHAI